MNYEQKYLKYKSKYLSLKYDNNFGDNSFGDNSLDLELVGGSKESEPKDKTQAHDTKLSIKEDDIKKIMKDTKFKKPETALNFKGSGIKSNDEVGDFSKNLSRTISRTLNKTIKKNANKNKKKNRTQSRTIVAIYDERYYQNLYGINPSIALKTIYDLSMSYGKKNIFSKIFDYTIKYGSDFVNNSIIFSSNGSEILSGDDISGVFTFRTAIGQVYQVNAINVGITSYTGGAYGVVWLWNYRIHDYSFGKIISKINKHSELNTAAGINTFSGTALTFTPGYLDSAEWFYMMIVGYLMRGKGYFVINHYNSTSFFIIKSIIQLQ
jgi:hypothetical protein